MDITIKRILKDIKILRDSNLNELGIYFNTDDNNIYNIQILLIGPIDSPYSYGNYLFDITFPSNYPFCPPDVKYCTQGLGIRFNPNLYICGKVCLSLLNTWSGPQWTSCNTLLSIILSIQSMVFVNNPLTNEPGYENDDSINAKTYQKIVEYGNYNIAILDILNNIPTKFQYFNSIIQDNFKKNYSNIINNLTELEKKYKKTKKNINFHIYNIHISHINFSEVLKNTKLYYENL